MINVSCCFKNCSGKFKCISEYRAHVRNLHDFEVISSYQCSIGKCKSKLLSFSNLCKHLMKVHTIPSSLSNKNSSTKDTEIPLTQKSSVQNGSSTISSISIEQTDECTVFASTSFIQPDNCIKNNDDSQGTVDVDSQLEAKMDKTMLLFLLNLHGKSHLTRTMIEQIFRAIKVEFLDVILDLCHVEKKHKNAVQKSYLNVNTFYKYQKKLKEQGLLDKACDDVISYKTGNIFKNGRSIVGEIKEKTSRMDIEFMFKEIFSLPTVLDSVLENTLKLQQLSTISNFVNGSRWKQICQHYSPDEIVIPFDLYFDDFETGNALGSNAGTHKIAAYYVSFPTFPSHLQSCTKYIFEVLLYPSRLKSTDMRFCLEKLSLIFKELETNGVEIETGGITRTVFFVLARVLGDNLGLNEILGFSKGFNAHKFCRLCDLTKESIQHCFTSSDADLRTIEKYEIDSTRNNTKATGIREVCVFNELDNFHCVDNLVCDLMHDLYEGVVKDLTFYIEKLIDDNEISGFSLDTLNKRKQNFPYGVKDIGNLSKPLDKMHLKNSTLKMSASETRTFLHLLPLMIGNLIPRDNVYWKAIIQLVEISELSLQPYFDNDVLNLLQKVISSYVSNYTKLVGKPLKPKHHFLTHYIQCIRKNGPLRSMMTFSYETKNKEVKAYANVTNQRINIAKSLMYKAVSRFDLFITEHANGFPAMTTHTSTKTLTKNDLKKKEYFGKILFDEHGILSRSRFDVCKYIEHKRTIYAVNNFIVDNQDTPIQLLKIHEIIVIGSKYYLILEQFAICEYDTHFCAYKAGKSLGSFVILTNDNICSLPFDLHTKYNVSYFKIKKI